MAVTHRSCPCALGGWPIFRFGVHRDQTRPTRTAPVDSDEDESLDLRHRKTGGFFADDSRCRLELAVVAKHLPDVQARFPDFRHPAFLYAMHPCIVGSQRKRKITLIAIEKVTELLGATPDVLD